ncbi:hypothetical protein PROFUN_04181 [Planoprotostelium fungivorum]|uniref:Protein kinase domain-containing protein n=1 Tax=Planoprotostelium fungivorum TaxID=1890364 RepID=A0A2P6NVW1_9EUKA|nr:hypothetical protein PROFUN_04181 [Planoprotostelium fungivorum]
MSKVSSSESSPHLDPSRIEDSTGGRSPSLRASTGLRSPNISSPVLNARNGLKKTISSLSVPDNLFTNRIEVPSDELLLKEKLGEGAFGSVYRAELWGSEVAVKKFTNISPSCLNEFYHEVSVLKSLRHMNIVLLMGYTRQPFQIICEILNQGSLYSVLHDENVRISHAQIMKAALGAAQGINYLHSKGIFHKDIKSQNVLIGDNFAKVKVCDFGLSLQRNDEVSSKYVGSAQWRAPEATSVHYTTKSDVYSYGVLLWECLTRKKPFAGMTVTETLQMTRAGRRPPIPFYCPTAFRDLIERCWQHDDPDKRPDFEEIIELLSSDDFLGVKTTGEAHLASAEELAKREVQSLHFILPEVSNPTQSSPRYARVYSSMFRAFGIDEGVDFVNEFIFSRDGSWDGAKCWDGGMLFTGDYGNYFAILVFNSMQSLKDGDQEIVKNVKNFEKLAELSCKTYMRELLEMVALDVKPGATAVLVCRYQTFPDHNQDLLEKYRSEVVPIMRTVEGWRGSLIFMNYESSRVMVMKFFTDNEALKQFQKSIPKVTRPLRNLLDSVPTLEKLRVEHGFLSDVIIKPLQSRNATETTQTA